MIIDASVALKWLVDEPDADRALELLRRIDLMAPVLVHAEVANGLTRKARRGELGQAPDLVNLTDRLTSFVQTIDEVPFIGRAVDLAGMLSHSVYGCVYLAMAEQLGQQLITADLKFLRKVESSDFAKHARAL